MSYLSRTEAAGIVLAILMAIAMLGALAAFVVAFVNASVVAFALGVWAIGAAILVGAVMFILDLG